GERGSGAHRAGRRGGADARDGHSLRRAACYARGRRRPGLSRQADEPSRDRAQVPRQCRQALVAAADQRRPARAVGSRPGRRPAPPARQAAAVGMTMRCAWAALALTATASPAAASAWNYACKGPLPVFNESHVIIFNRELLAILPKTWLKGTVRDL